MAESGNEISMSYQHPIWDNEVWRGVVYISHDPIG